MSYSDCDVPLHKEGARIHYSGSAAFFLKSVFVVQREIILHLRTANSPDSGNAVLQYLWLLVLNRTGSGVKSSKGGH